MNKLLKRILIGLGAVVGAFIIFIVVFLILLKNETSKMTTIETGKICENVYAIQDDYTNMFLIKSGKDYIAVDAANDVKHIEKEIKKMNIEPERIKAVFLTHSDEDHIASISLFKNAKIYISEKEEQMINGETSRFFILKNSLNTDYKTLKENQEINISGIKIKGVSAPGHTPGSICWIINDKFLFTGDAMSIKLGKIGLFNSFFNMDDEIQAKSLKKIANLSGIEYIFSAHYGFTNDFDGAFKEWK